MRMTPEAFRAWDSKRITLLGMSGVGKTRLSGLLPREEWFHYSGDYRIGTHYLDEAIVDNIKQKAMQIPFLRDLMRSDSVYIRNNVSFHNLNPVASFLGKIGNPELGGLPLNEFLRRQRLHHDAEVATMLDVPRFIDKAKSIYDYSQFINDAGGSLCELDAPEVMETLSQHTLVLYIRATDADEERLIERAITDPKPLYYREEFLRQALTDYMREEHLDYIAQIDPNDFGRWVFPKLFRTRLPRYDQIARAYGYSISSEDVLSLRDEVDFMSLIEDAIRRKDR